MKIAQRKQIIKLCNGLHSEPDYKKVIKNIESGVDDFEVDNVRFISDDAILTVMVDELFDDNYILGGFNAAFIAENSHLNNELVEVCQQSDAYEAIVKALNDTLSQDEKESFCEAYAGAAGYGHHFNHYDGGEEEITINDVLYHVFDNQL